MNLLNSSHTTENTNTSDVKSDHLLVPYTGYKGN